MTVAHSKAWDELQWACSYRDTLEFRKEYCVGQLVFMFNKASYKWIPYWVVEENEGKSNLISAYGDERVDGVCADQLGIAVNADGKTYQELY